MKLFKQLDGYWMPLIRPPRQRYKIKELGKLREFYKHRGEAISNRSTLL